MTRNICCNRTIREIVNLSRYPFLWDLFLHSVYCIYFLRLFPLVRYSLFREWRRGEIAPHRPGATRAGVVPGRSDASLVEGGETSARAASRETAERREDRRRRVASQRVQSVASDLPHGEVASATGRQLRVTVWRIS